MKPSKTVAVRKVDQNIQDDAIKRARLLYEEQLLKTKKQSETQISEFNK